MTSARLAPTHPLASGRTAASPLIQAYRGVRPERQPVWFMRQAGRSLPEYRALRAGGDMLEACLDPQLASELTLQPVRRHGVDAGIFFSDIVVPLKLAGLDVRIVPGRGPVFAEPVRDAAAIARLPELDTVALAPVVEAVRRTVAALDDLDSGGSATPLIGFAGAPFTLAAYLVEGGPSKDHLAARTLMHADPESWRALTDWAARATGAFLRAQVEAGASAAQLFDSWAGSLSLADYTERVAPASAAALAPVRELSFGGGTDRPAETVPIVHFGVGTGDLLLAMRDVGADVIGVDYRVPLDEASRRLGHVVPLQGNIDPALLAAPWPVLEAHVTDVLERGRTAPAHVLNLGHGVPPNTDPAVLTRLTEFVHSFRDEREDASVAVSDGVPR